MNEFLEAPQDIGSWLAGNLSARGMSQTELAERLGVTRAAVNAWINGRAAPRPDKVPAIRAIFDRPFAPVAQGLIPTAWDGPISGDRLTWFHRAAHPDGGRELGNAASFAFDVGLPVLAREATQNSLDERRDQRRPVRVRFTLHEISGPLLDRFLHVIQWPSLEPHLHAAADTGQKVGRVIANGLNELQETRRLLLLRIDDYNASGLTGPEYGDGRFAAVVRRQLDSHKRALASGGSHGLGKVTLWSASQFGLVLINSTLCEPHDGQRTRRMIGRLDLPWRSVDGVEFAGPAWFGDPDPDPMKMGATQSWWGDEATAAAMQMARDGDSPGTSFLIVGLHDSAGETNGIEEMHGLLVRSLAQNFWASMIAKSGESPLLEAFVVAKRNDTVVVTEERVDPHAHEPARSRTVQAFLNRTTVDRLTSAEDVVETSVPLRVPPLKGTAVQKTPVEHRAVLLLTPTDEEDPAPNRLVCMRSSRMVVLTRPVTDLPLGAPKFQAVLLAGLAAGTETPDAIAAETFLRASEPPEHHDWTRTDDLVATYTRGAVTCIKTFRTAMSEEIRRILRRPEERRETAPSALRELLDLTPPPPPRNPAYPTVKNVTGSIRDDGAWQVHVEIKVPARSDPWVLMPVLKFATRSGPKPKASWAALTAESGCEITEDGKVRIQPGTKIASLTGISDASSHPVAAQMAMVEVDLARAEVTAP